MDILEKFSLSIELTSCGLQFSLLPCSFLSILALKTILILSFDLSNRGGLFGGLLYDVFIYVGEDSFINQTWGNVSKITNEKSSFSNNKSEKAVSFV